MAKVTASTQAAVDPERVWQLVIDLPRFPEWNIMHDAFIGDVPEKLGEGVAYKQRVKMMNMPAEFAWRVTSADEPGKLELSGDGPMGIKAVNRFIVEKADGGSHITFEMEFNGPALNGPIAKMAEKQSAVAAQQSIDKFATLLT
jgi:carbon monoxide dehydrogenase subunit G